jgi:hypothetical protein
VQRSGAAAGGASHWADFEVADPSRLGAEQVCESSNSL